MTVNQAEELTNRLFNFAVAAVRLANALPPTVTGRHISGQFLRSGTSAAANYEEACAAESKADFLHKLQITLKELKESRFWLRLTIEAELAAKAECIDLLQESDALCKIIAKSVITAKNNRQ